MENLQRQQQIHFDRRVGYILLLLLSVLFCLSVAVGISFYFRPMHTYVIIFKKIGGLKGDDPIQIHGATVGFIKAVEPGPYDVRVIATTYKKLTLFKDYSIYTADKGIMGESVIVLDPGTAEALPLTTDTLQGECMLSVAEMIGYAWKLQRFLQNLKLTTGRSLTDTTMPTNHFSVDLFTSLVDHLDSLTQQVTATIRKIKVSATPFSDSLYTATVEIEKILSTVITSFNTNADDYEHFLLTLNKAMTKLDPLVTNYCRTIVAVERYSTHSAQTFVELNITITRLQQLVSQIQDGTVDLKVRMKLLP
ncbi:MAG: MCE family protein [Chitinivibrionales bacterium]|nr:MCE family protein [Chitinivibrionales bacterium]